MLAVYFSCPEKPCIPVNKDKKKNQYTYISGNEISASVKEYRIKSTIALFSIPHVAMKVKQPLQKANAKCYSAELLSNTLKWETDSKPVPEILYCLRSTV